MKKFYSLRKSNIVLSDINYSIYKYWIKIIENRLSEELESIERSVARSTKIGIDIPPDLNRRVIGECNREYWTKRQNNQSRFLTPRSGGNKHL
jgi:hypothetical protein